MGRKIEMQCGDAAIPSGLKRILADCFVLRFMVCAAGWRIDRAQCDGLAERLDRFVAFLDDAARETSLRMRVLGSTPPNLIDELTSLSSCQLGAEDDDLAGVALAALQVASDFSAMALIAGESGDVATAHFLMGKIGQFEEAAWSIGRLSADESRRPGVARQ